jgi:hypothetical protein
MQMESVLLDIIPKEVVGQGWQPNSPTFVHRISNQMRTYQDALNENHDLVISDPSRMRFRVASTEDMLLEQFTVAIIDAFSSIQVALTKTLRSKTDFSKLPINTAEKLKAAFVRLL